MQNKSDKDMTGLKGVLVFIDMFGQDIGKFGIKYEDGIQVGKEKVVRRLSGYV